MISITVGVIREASSTAIHCDPVRVVVSRIFCRMGNSTHSHVSAAGTAIQSQ